MTEAIVSTALQYWDLAEAPVELAAKRENQVFRVAAPGGPLALRLHRKDYRSRAQILSELQWMAILSDGGLSLPRPWPTPDGELCITIDGTYISMVSWLDGSPMGHDGHLTRLDEPEVFFFALGKAMARLHELSDAWTPPGDFVRPAWHIEGILGNDALWGRFWENPELTHRQSRHLLHARDIAREELERLAPTLDYGLIHADLVPENVLFHHTQLQLIDFDDGGFGFRLFDLATTVNRCWREDPSGVLAAAVLNGYRSARAIDQSNLPLFRAVRAFTYLGWIIPRLNEAGATARCRRFMDLSRQWADWLIEGHSMLPASFHKNNH